MKILWTRHTQATNGNKNHTPWGGFHWTNHQKSSRQPQHASGNGAHFDSLWCHIHKIGNHDLAVAPVFRRELIIFGYSSSATFFGTWHLFCWEKGLFSPACADFSLLNHAYRLVVSSTVSFYSCCRISANLALRGVIYAIRTSHQIRVFCQSRQRNRIEDMCGNCIPNLFHNIKIFFSFHRPKFSFADTSTCGCFSFYFLYAGLQICT